MKILELIESARHLKPRSDEEGQKLLGTTGAMHMDAELRAE